LKAQLSEKDETIAKLESSLIAEQEAAKQSEAKIQKLQTQINKSVEQSLSSLPFPPPFF